MNKEALLFKHRAECYAFKRTESVYWLISLGGAILLRVLIILDVCSNLAYLVFKSKLKEDEAVILAAFLSKSSLISSLGLVLNQLYDFVDAKSKCSAAHRMWQAHQNFVDEFVTTDCEEKDVEIINSTGYEIMYFRCYFEEYCHKNDPENKFTPKIF